MIKQRRDTVSFSALVMVSVVAGFPLPSLSAELRVGYVNVVKVLEEAPQGLAALKKLETEFGPRDKELVALQKRVQLMEEELLKQPANARDPELRRRERELLTLKREQKRLTQEFREDHNQRRNEELSVLQQTVHRAVAELAKQEKYDLIVNEGTLYASDAVDITDKVLKKLGKP